MGLIVYFHVEFYEEVAIFCGMAAKSNEIIHLAFMPRFVHKVIHIFCAKLL